MAAQLLTARHWIDGEWVDSADRLDSIDPATGKIIGHYANGGAAEALQAVAVARRTFVETEWRENRRLRARALNEMADRFEARSEDLIEILALENGKIVAEARFEVSMAAPKLRFYAALALVDFGRAIETAPGRYSTVLRQPVGVAGIIAPWNSPIVLFIRSLAPALAAGCTVVGKLPGWTAQTNARMCEVFAEVMSLPKGVLNVFSELHSDGARAMIDSPDVPTISFTGSSATGKAISAAGAKTPQALRPRTRRQDAGAGVRRRGSRPRAAGDREGADRLCRAVLHDRQPLAGPSPDPRHRAGAAGGAPRSSAGRGRRRTRRATMGPMINRANVERVDLMVEAAIAAGAQVGRAGRADH